MTHLRAPILLLLASIAAAMSCGYAAAQDADKNPWMAEVAKAAADGRCDEAKTIALRNGSLDAAEQAYRRSDALEKRRRLMADWAAFCG